MHESNRENKTSSDKAAMSTFSTTGLEANCTDTRWHKCCRGGVKDQQQTTQVEALDALLRRALAVERGNCLCEGLDATSMLAAALLHMCTETVSNHTPCLALGVQLLQVCKCLLCFCHL